MIDVFAKTFMTASRHHPLTPWPAPDHWLESPQERSSKKWPWRGGRWAKPGSPSAPNA